MIPAAQGLMPAAQGYGKGHVMSSTWTMPLSVTEDSFQMGLRFIAKSQSYKDYANWRLTDNQARTDWFANKDNSTKKSWTFAASCTDDKTKAKISEGILNEAPTALKEFTQLTEDDETMSVENAKKIKNSRIFWANKTHLIV